MNDLISRNEMLKWLEVSEFEHLSGEKCFECMMREIKNAPAVNRWISVEDDLPEKGKCVLCACRANIMCVLKWTGTEWYENQSHCYMSGFVTHWMPLPEPPEKE